MHAFHANARNREFFCKLWNWCTQASQKLGVPFPFVRDCELFSELLVAFENFGARDIFRLDGFADFLNG